MISCCCHSAFSSCSAVSKADVSLNKAAISCCNASSSFLTASSAVVRSSILSEVEWNRDSQGTGLNALIAASFQADGTSDPKREIKPGYADSLAKDTKINNGIVTSVTLEPTVTEYTTLQWRCTSVPLSLEEDKHWLSELQCYIRFNFVEASDDALLLQEPICFVRKECLEAYSATSNDVLSCPNACIEGQVGIRCKFCSQAKPSVNELDYLTYPSSIDEIKDAVKMIIKNHLRRCPCMPKKFRNILESKRTPLRNFKAENDEYWIDAAKESGMSDCHDGTIRFFRDPNTKGAAERLFLSFDKEDVWEKPLAYCQPFAGM